MKKREPCSHVQLISQSHIHPFHVFSREKPSDHVSGARVKAGRVGDQNEKLRQQDVKLMKMEKLVSLMWSLMERGNT